VEITVPGILVDYTSFEFHSARDGATRKCFAMRRRRRRKLWRKTIFDMMTLAVIMSAIGAAWYYSRPKDLPAQFQPLLSEFIREGNRLADFPGQGVKHVRYAEHLASTTAAYELLATVWPSDYKREARQQFSIALSEWNVLDAMWKRALKVYPDGSFGSDLVPAIVQELEAAAPGRIVFSSGEPKVVDVEASISRLLTSAARHFQAGQGLILE
jgi:hypothetical protein